MAMRGQFPTDDQSPSTLSARAAVVIRTAATPSIRRPVSVTIRRAHRVVVNVGICLDWLAWNIATLLVMVMDFPIQ